MASDDLTSRQQSYDLPTIFTTLAAVTMVGFGIIVKDIFVCHTPWKYSNGKTFKLSDIFCQ